MGTTCSWFNLDAGVYQGYKPYVVIEIGADGKLKNQDIVKYQDFLFKKQN